MRNCASASRGLTVVVVVEELTVVLVTAAVVEVVMVEMLVVTVVVASASVDEIVDEALVATEVVDSMTDVNAVVDSVPMWLAPEVVDSIAEVVGSITEVVVRGTVVEVVEAARVDGESSVVDISVVVTTAAAAVGMAVVERSSTCLDVVDVVVWSKTSWAVNDMILTAAA